MAEELSRALQAIRDIDLDVPQVWQERGLEGMPGGEAPELDAAKAQAAVVDSNVVAFPEGVSEQVRAAVSDWMLFAQRAATKKHPKGTDSQQWADEYLDVMLATGWSLRESASAWSEESVSGSVVHQKILDVIAVVLGPVPAALAIVTAALNSLQAMNEDSRWITLFDRRGKSATSVGFSVANVEAEGDGAAALRSVDFRIEASKTLTQVLFFKFTHQEASMFRRGVVLSISAKNLERLGPKIAERVAEMAEDSIAGYDL